MADVELNCEIHLGGEFGPHEIAVTMEAGEDLTGWDVIAYAVPSPGSATRLNLGASVTDAVGKKITLHRTAAETEADWATGNFRLGQYLCQLAFVTPAGEVLQPHAKGLCDVKRQEARLV